MVEVISENNTCTQTQRLTPIYPGARDPWKAEFRFSVGFIKNMINIDSHDIFPWVYSARFRAVITFEHTTASTTSNTVTTLTREIHLCYFPGLLPLHGTTAKCHAEKRVTPRFT